MKIMPKTRKIGRNAINGEFTSIEYAIAHPETAIVQTFKVGQTKKGKCKK
jgi:hypothetical protein